jgi:hypothetical protein
MNAPAAFIHPCRPTVSKRPPRGPGWVHELKHDGYRLQIHIRDGRVRLYSMNAADFSLLSFAKAKANRQERDFSGRRPPPQNGLVRRQEQRDRRVKEKSPPNSGPTSHVSTKYQTARLRGGGRSRSRTGLTTQIPC